MFSGSKQKGRAPAKLPARDPPYLRKTIREPPVLFRVYFVTARQHVASSSVIHLQKQDAGFFRHPALIVERDDGRQTADFYTLTSYPPRAIRDLRMYFRLGERAQDDGEDVLKLAPGSDRMPRRSYVNLEQRFTLEWEHLDYLPWPVTVDVESDERVKLDSKIRDLEAQQNRFIYKPLPADFHNVTPGTVVMLSNAPQANTLGAPVIILANNYPNFRYLRIKLVADNSIFNPTGKAKYTIARRNCLKICGNTEGEDDGYPTLLFEAGSPALRQPSYVEVTTAITTAHADRLKTWCVPPVRIQQDSMKKIWDHMATLSRTGGNNHSQPLVKKKPSAVTQGQFGRPSAQHQQQTGYRNYEMYPPTWPQQYPSQSRAPFTAGPQSAQQAFGPSYAPMAPYGLPGYGYGPYVPPMPFVPSQGNEHGWAAFNPQQGPQQGSYYGWGAPNYIPFGPMWMSNWQEVTPPNGVPTPAGGGAVNNPASPAANTTGHDQNGSPAETPPPPDQHPDPSQPF